MVGSYRHIFFDTVLHWLTSKCRKAKATCSSGKRFPFMVGLLPDLKIARFYSQANWYSFRGRDHYRSAGKYYLIQYAFLACRNSI